MFDTGCVMMGMCMYSYQGCKNYVFYDKYTINLFIECLEWLGYTLHCIASSALYYFLHTCGDFRIHFEDYCGLYSARHAFYPWALRRTWNRNSILQLNVHIHRLVKLQWIFKLERMVTLSAFHVWKKCLQIQYKTSAI